ncbi:MAG: NADP-dependent oxidoreductase [Candidatus Dormiibacterota bacterium]
MSSFTPTRGDTMRAVAINEFGMRPTVVELPVPEPGPGEVVVRVRASSVNGFDVAVAAGAYKAQLAHQFPVVLGKDFAGTVEAVGEGASRFHVGEVVFGVVMKDGLGDGSFAQFVCVAEHPATALVPDGLDLESAGALGLAGTTAVATVEVVALQAGEVVLISGATGGVGALAIQLATALGAHVIATAAPGPGSQFVRSLGAEHVVDHTGDLSAQVRALAPSGVAAVLHFAGDGTQLYNLLAPDGRLASTLGVGSDQHPAANAIITYPDAATLEYLADEVVAGRLRVPIDHNYQLAEVPEALSDFASGTLGKLAVTVD